MTSAAEFQAKVEKASTNMDRFDGIVNGGPTTVVETDNGSVPSMAKVVVDYQDAIGGFENLNARLDLVDSDVAQALAPDRPVIETGGQAFGVPDQEGSYGGGSAMYIKATPQYFRATAMGIAGNITFTGAATDGRMAGFIKLPVTGSAGLTKRIIADAATNAYLMQDADAPITATSYVSIAMFVVGQPGIQGLNGFRWLDQGESHVFPTGLAIVENGEVLLPQSYLFDGSGFENLLPEDGSAYFPRGLQPNQGIARRYIFDKTLKDISGGTYTSAVIAVDGTTAPIDDKYKQTLLATCTGRIVSSEYFQFAGEQGTPSSKDQSTYGFDADAYSVRFGNAAIRNFTDTKILELGYTRGAWNPSTTGTDRSVYFGVTMRPKYGQRGVVRFVAEIIGTVDLPNAENSNYLTVFNDMRVYLRQGGNVTSNGTVRMLRRLSPNAAEFIAWVGVATDTTDNMVIGADKNGINSYNVIVSPASWHFSEVPALLVPRTSMTNTELAIGDHLFAIRGQTVPIYTSRITKYRSEMPEHITTISGAKGYSISGGPLLLIDPDKAGNDLTFDLRMANAPNNRFRKRVALYTGPASVAPGSSIVLNFQGDSLTAYGLVKMVAETGQSLGYNVTTTGTLMNQGGGTPTAPLYPGEGHPGKTVAQMVGKTAGMDPIAVADLSAYLAMSDDDKNNRNIYMKPFEAGVDNPAYKVTLNGADYIWSAAYAHARTGQSAPTHFIFSGGRNDQFFDAANAVANVEFAFDVRYNQSRAYRPDAVIIFFYAGEPVSVENDRDWPLQYKIIQAYRKKVAAARAAGDTKVFFVSAFAQSTAEAWDDLTTISISAESDTQKGIIQDTTHMGPVPKQQCANALMACINATSGATAAKTTEQRVADLEDGGVASVAGKTGAVTLVAADISNSTTAGRAVLVAADIVAQRTAMAVPGLLTSNVFVGSQFIRNTLYASSDGAGTLATLLQHDGVDGYMRSNTGRMFFGANGTTRLVISAAGDSFAPTTNNSMSLGTSASRWALGAFVDINMSGVFTSRLTIDQAGDAALWMKGNSFVSMFIDSARDSASDHAMLVARVSRGTIAAPTALLSGDTMLNIQVRAWDGAGLYRNTASVFVRATENHTATAMGSATVITGTANGTNSGAEVASFQPGVGMSMFGANPVIGPNRELIRPQRTMGTLPVQPYRASEWEITDGPNAAPAFGAAAVGGGSTTRPVRSTGTAWVFG